MRACDEFTSVNSFSFYQPSVTGNWYFNKPASKHPGEQKFFISWSEHSESENMPAVQSETWAQINNTCSCAMTAAWTEILIKTCSFEGTRSLVLVQSLNFICSQTLIWKSSASPAGFETATVTIWIKQTCDTERGGGEWWELNLVHRSTSRRQAVLQCMAVK